MGALISAVAELVVFGLPAAIYLAVRATRGHGRDARQRMGLVRGDPRGYLLALAVLAVCLGLGCLSLLVAGALHPAALPHGRSTGGLTATVGAPAGPAGTASAVLTATAEELLFRGFLGGLLIGRLGFAAGNAVQALLFVLPHAALLAVAPGLWPILPTQLVAGWLLGWLRHRTGSILPGAAAHAATNILVALLATA